MNKHFCDRCSKPIDPERDLVNGQLQIIIPASGDRSGFILKMEALSLNNMRPTSRDYCRECLDV